MKKPIEQPSDPAIDPFMELALRASDGVLNESEREKWEKIATEQPELADFAKLSRSIGTAVRDVTRPQAGEELPFPDFFNSQLEKRIEEETSPAAQKNIESQRWWAPQSLLSWFSSPLTIGAALLAVLFLAFNGFQKNEIGTRIVNVYAPDDHIVVNSFFSQEAGASVIFLDGLAAIPDEIEISGKSIVSYVPTNKSAVAGSASSEVNLAFVRTTGNPLPLVQSIDQS